MVPREYENAVVVLEHEIFADVIDDYGLLQVSSELGEVLHLDVEILDQKLAANLEPICQRFWKRNVWKVARLTREILLFLVASAMPKDAKRDKIGCHFLVQIVIFDDVEILDQKMAADLGAICKRLWSRNVWKMDLAREI